MKYDIVIIGGGLSGLTAGISLASAGKKVCMVAAGQNTLHFSSGSFDLLGYDTEGAVITENPLEAIGRLPERHPYRKITSEKLPSLAQRAKNLLNEVGFNVNGDSTCNHFRLTPVGDLKPAWLTMDGLVQVPSTGTFPWKKVEIINIQGFLDMPVSFLQENLKERGVECAVKTVTTPELEYARESPTEMRATNVARVMSDEGVVAALAERINAVAGNVDALLLPSVFAWSNANLLADLRKQVHQPIELIATLPPSVAGTYCSHLLKKHFLGLGGTILTGDTVTGGKFTEGRLCAVVTSHLPGEELYADTFILAAGSFVSHGLASNYERVYEPVFGLDVTAAADRQEWYQEYIFDAQPYMEFGVNTDSSFRASLAGKTVSNLFAVGSILSGQNSLKLADATGVSMLTALQVSDLILGGK